MSRRHNEMAPRPRTPLLSACLIVRDEEETLPACLASLHRTVDEVVVYDTGSTDSTVTVAKRAGARVLEGYWDDDFARARNASLQHCRGDWVLWIDADERLTCDDPRRLRALLGELGQRANIDALLVDIYNYGGDGSSLANAHRAFRIFRKDRCRWYGALHEQVDLRTGQVDGRSAIRAATVAGVRLDHLGYTDQIMRARDKVARNLRIAETAVKEPPEEGLAGIAELNLARALAATGRFGDAQAYFTTALERVQPGVQQRTVLVHMAQNLVALGRFEEAAQTAATLKDLCENKGLATYLEGLAHRRLGELDTAISLFRSVNELRDDEGLSYPDAILRAELAGALVEAGRHDEAAEELLLLVGEHPEVLALVVAMKVFASTGRPPAQFASALPQPSLEKAAAALVLVPPAIAAPFAEALLYRFGQRPQLLAAAIRFAPALPALQALEWSARLRSIGLDSRCPLVARAQDPSIEVTERARAAATAYAAFGDRRSEALLLELAHLVGPADLPTVLAEVEVLSPALLDQFACAARGANREVSSTSAQVLALSADR